MQGEVQSDVILYICSDWVKEGKEEWLVHVKTEKRTKKIGFRPS